MPKSYISKYINDSLTICVERKLIGFFLNTSTYNHYHPYLASIGRGRDFPRTFVEDWASCWQCDKTIMSCVQNFLDNSSLPDNFVTIVSLRPSYV